jgi:hypothetical protein
MKEIIKRWDDAKIEARIQVGRWQLTYKLYELENDTHPDLRYRRKGWGGTGDTTTDIEQAEVMCEGDVRFIGCSNFRTTETGAYIHRCSRQQQKMIFDILDHMYDIAEQYSGETGFEP